MIPPKLPTYSNNQLEQMAESLLTETFGQIEVPVDVDLLIEKREDTTLDYWPGLKPNHNILGAVFLDAETKQFLVVVDDGLADDVSQRNRYRMTVAEELGHLVLHGNVIRQIAHVDDFRELQRHEDWRTIERNAKRFAAAILMPGSILMVEANAIYGKLVKVAGFNDINVVQKYLKSQLAGRFEVSPETMGYRLDEWPMRINAKVQEAMKARLSYLG